MNSLKLHSFILQIRAIIGHILSNLLSFVWSAPLTCSNVFDAVFFTRILRSKSLIDSETRVKSAKLASYGTHRGLAGEVQVIELEYANLSKHDKNDAESAPPKLILKRNQSTIQSRKLSINKCGSREADFFQCRLVQTYLDLNLVEPPLYAHGSQLLGEYLLIMQDLNRLPKAIPTNKIMGDQVFGNGCDDVPRAIATLGRLYDAIAAVHARHWCDETLMNEPILKAVDWRAGNGAITWNTAVARATAMWQAGKVKYASIDEVNLKDNFIQLIDRCLATSTFDNAHKHLNQCVFTLAHGDFHASNMFCVGDGFRFCDWSEIGLGEPLAEIGQCIVSDLHHDYFEEHIDKLLQRYYRALCDNGVEGYDWEQCRADFSRATIERWIFFVAILAGYPIPPKLMQYFHDQLYKFVELYGDFEHTYTFKSVYCMI